MEKQIIITFFSILLIASCSLSEFLGDKDLGGGYFLWTEGKNGQSNCVILSSNKPYNGIGLMVIPATVTMTSHNSKLILVMSRNPQLQREEYWIIDKENPVDLQKCIDKESCEKVLRDNVLGPLDLEGFRHVISDRNIQLRFD